MTRKNTGKQFETLTMTVFKQLIQKSSNSSVEMDVQLEGPDGNRQIDVLITHNLDYCTMRTMVECKDYNSIINVTVIDAIPTKLRDLNIDKAVIVSRKGYSKTAIQKAKRYGISLFTLDNLENITGELIPNFPVMVKEILPVQFSPSFKLTLVKPTSLPCDLVLTINDHNIPVLFQELLLNRQLPLDLGNLNEWYLDQIPKPHYIRDSSGNKIYIEKTKISYELTQNFYFGYLIDLPRTLSLRDIVVQKETIFVKAESLVDYHVHLRQFADSSLIPATPLVNFAAIQCPDYNMADLTTSITQLTTGNKMIYKTKSQN